MFSAFGQQFASAAATVVLARRLTRVDFGIVAVATTVIGLLYTATDAGLGAGIIARREVDDRVVSSTFWVACILGAFVSALCALLSGPVSSLLGVPAAQPYVAVSSVLVLAGLSQSVLRGFLMRHLRFRLVYGSDLVSVVVYVTVEIVLALTTGLGAWVVVIGQLAMEATQSIMLFVGARWLPALVLDLAEVRADLRFNAGYLGATTANYASKNADN